MSQPLPRASQPKSIVSIAAVIIVLVAIRLFLAPATGAQLGERSLMLGSSIADTVTTQKLSFSMTSPSTLGSISVEFCTNSPFVSDPCTAPAGLDADDVSLGGQTGQTGFTIANDSNTNRIILSRTPAPAGAGAVSYIFNDVRNPSNAGSYFVRLQTFATSDASGGSNDYGAVVIAINANLSVSAEVPPYLIFCAGISVPILDCSSVDGNYIDFGELSPTRASQSTSQMLTATNARDGYNITLAGTTLTSGNNVVDPLTSSDISRAGNSQFGLDLRANNSPAGGTDPNGPGLAGPQPTYGQANFYKFVPGDVLVSVDKPDDIRRYTTSYIVNVPKNQAPGVYVSTVSYICLANY